MIENNTDGADGSNRDAGVKSDAFGKAWLDQGVEDDASAGAALGDVRSRFHLAFDCVCREMGSGLGDSSHVTSRDDNSTTLSHYTTECALVCSA